MDDVRKAIYCELFFHIAARRDELVDLLKRVKCSMVFNLPECANFRGRAPAPRPRSIAATSVAQAFIAETNHIIIMQSLKGLIAICRVNYRWRERVKNIVEMDNIR